MKKWWNYVALGAGGFFLSAGSCGTGYFYGYYKSEPEIARLDLQKDGIEGMCVYKNRKELVCATDITYAGVNSDGAVDYVVVDVETQKVKEFVPGKDDCVKKYTRLLEEEMKKQNQEQPKQ